MTEYIPLYLISNDDSAYPRGGPIQYGFTTPMSQPLGIDQGDLPNWQVVLTGASLYHPGPASPLFVYCSMVSPISVGSGSNPLLCIIPAAAAPGTYSYVAQSNPPGYTPILQTSASVSVWICDKYGASPPATPDGVTSISLMLVRSPQ